MNSGIMLLLAGAVIGVALLVVIARSLAAWWNEWWRDNPW